MALSIAQSTGQPTTNHASVAFTLGSNPSAGNMLLAFCAYSQSGATRTISAPSGSWTQVFSVAAGGNGNDSLACFRYTVQGGDGATWTFTVSSTGGNDFTSGALYEITGQAATPVNGSATTSISASTASFVSPNVTPSVNGCLALAAFTTDDAPNVNSVTSGWTVDVAEGNNFHGSAAAHQTALTSGTSTPVSCTFTLSATSVGVTGTVLVAPAGPPAPGAGLLASCFP